MEGVCLYVYSRLNFFLEIAESTTVISSQKKKKNKQQPSFFLLKWFQGAISTSCTLEHYVSHFYLLGVDQVLLPST